jgi:hypothetical protein
MRVWSIAGGAGLAAWIAWGWLILRLEATVQGPSTTLHGPAQFFFWMFFVGFLIFLVVGFGVLFVLVYLMAAWDRLFGTKHAG